MNKKGFTLIELIAVIAILGLLITLVTPKLMKNFNDKKERLYKATIEEIERVAGMYLTENEELYSNISSVGYVDITTDMLCDNKYITCPINNPINNDDIYGYVRVSYENNKYIYKFSNNNYLNENVLVTLDLNGGSMFNNISGRYKEGTVIHIDAPTKENTTFLSWNVVKGNSTLNKSELTVGSTDTIVYALYEIWSALEIDLNGGTTSNNQAGRYKSGTMIELEEPTKENYKFTGWEVIKGNGILSGNSLTIGDIDVKIKALWELNEFNLTIDLDGGTTSNNQNGKYIVGSNITLESPTREGYTFKGWTLVSGNGDLSGNTFTMGNTATVIKANWELNVFNLTVEPNGGMLTKNYDGEYEVGSNITLEIPTKTGYTFTGWTLVSGNGDLSGNTFTMGDTDAVIKANWIGNTYTVTLNANGGGFNVQEYTTPVEHEYIVPKTGDYKLEVWGAQGGTRNGIHSNYVGYGGYSTGVTYLEQGTVLYINVGGAGGVSSVLNGGYNGGGNGGEGTQYGSGGGGATHIATESGILSSLSQYAGNNNSPILIVAGGGGGDSENYRGYGGSGGGISGKNGYDSHTESYLGYNGTGGNQTSGGITANKSDCPTGTFGQGTNYCLAQYGGSGGGGGYYGGGSSNRGHGGGGGGSGYIGNDLLTNKAMYCYNCAESVEETTKTISTQNASDTPISNYAKQGDGAAKIWKSIEEVQVIYNLQYGELLVPTREGYAFIGWYTEPIGGEEIIESIKYNILGNQTLYAHWKKTEFEFVYSGNEEVFVVPLSGEYELEVWGAEGGTGMMDGVAKNAGGYGGYSTGIIYLEEGETIYINVGGKGVNSSDGKAGGSGGYNGGGNGGTDSNYTSAGNNEPGAGGGGATHIAKSTGLLSTFNENTKDQILIVAGGGGGSGGHGAGGTGGGIAGATGTSTSTIQGEQSSGNAFGLGGVGVSSTTGGGGGGGGLYGGGGATANGGSGGGGSGYIGNELLTDKVMNCYNCTESQVESTKTISTTNISLFAISNYAKLGNGYAKIRLIEKE